MKRIFLLFASILASSLATLDANNITLSNVTTTGNNSVNKYSLVGFDISWSNSWRSSSSPPNWDAAWIFVKFKVGSVNPVFNGASSSGTTVTVSNTGNLRVGMPVVVSSGTGSFDYNLTGASSSSTTVTVSSTANLQVGMPLQVTGGTGSFFANTVISSITNGTQFVVNFAPSVALSGASITCFGVPVISSITDNTHFVVSSTPSVALSSATLTCLRIWEHATLNTTSGNHTAPAGSTIGVPVDGKGVFIYRSSNGTGNFNLTGVQLRWEYGTDGLSDTTVIKVQVFAMEMVYVPTGDFAAGSGGTGSNEFTLTTINTATANTVPGGSGSLGGQAGGYPTGQTAPNANWPNGYNAFYCMKYEVSQGQYRDFLNMLTYRQQINRTATAPSSSAGTGSNSSTNANRNGIDIMTSAGTSTSSTPAAYACNLDGDGNYNEAEDGEGIACNFISFQDGLAYMDWSGLRPMTELEYEKACRGNQTPVANGYAWGDTTSTNASGINNPGLNNETYSNSGAKCAMNNNINVQGPLRVGSFAGASTTRTQAGASYWGIMELSGNLWERPVTMGNLNGRNYTDVPGDGALSINGHANNATWPGLISGEVTNVIAGALGASFRGGTWLDVSARARVSDRLRAVGTNAARGTEIGARGVRSAP